MSTDNLERIDSINAAAAALPDRAQSIRDGSGVDIEGVYDEALIDQTIDNANVRIQTFEDEEGSYLTSRQMFFPDQNLTLKGDIADLPSRTYPEYYDEVGHELTESGIYQINSIGDGYFIVIARDNNGDLPSFMIEANVPIDVGGVIPIYVVAITEDGTATEPADFSLMSDITATGYDMTACSFICGEADDGGIGVKHSSYRSYMSPGMRLTNDRTTVVNAEYGVSPSVGTPTVHTEKQAVTGTGVSVLKRYGGLGTADGAGSYTNVRRSFETVDYTLAHTVVSCRPVTVDIKNGLTIDDQFESLDRLSNSVEPMVNFIGSNFFNTVMESFTVNNELALIACSSEAPEVSGSESTSFKHYTLHPTDNDVINVDERLGYQVFDIKQFKMASQHYLIRAEVLPDSDGESLLRLMKLDAATGLFNIVSSITVNTELRGVSVFSVNGSYFAFAWGISETDCQVFRIKTDGTLSTMTEVPSFIGGLSQVVVTYHGDDYMPRFAAVQRSDNAVVEFRLQRVQNGKPIFHDNIIRTTLPGDGLIPSGFTPKSLSVLRDLDGEIFLVSAAAGDQYGATGDVVIYKQGAAADLGPIALLQDLSELQVIEIDSVNYIAGILQSPDVNSSGSVKLFRHVSEGTFSQVFSETVSAPKSLTFERVNNKNYLFIGTATGDFHNLTIETDTAVYGWTSHLFKL